MNVRTHREITSHQIADCLGSVNVLTSHITNLREQEVEDKSDAGGALVALEHTLSRVCDRLEKIMDDPARWGLPETDGHALHHAQDFITMETGSLLNRRNKGIMDSADRQIAALQSAMTTPTRPPRKPKK